ncbi:trigger factor [Alkalibaculum sp. M08DMB]|uniref:Trigger factor n=1 Tax=Alkalibaculum sporogenes TaxID=2655001 RepID=A0A6A7K934_9FIRM|nr:trigger factor [Alkalibaculum sporogenes]MPW25902.1 trigger factor [Alkalibaculum sporogenes]
MVSTVEKIEKNVATLKIEVSSEDFNKAINKSYNKNKVSFNVAGFRKGKAPRSIIERQYGENVFYEDALDFAFPEAYSKAIEEHELFPVARPDMETIDQISASEGLTITVSVAIKPEVVLGEYKGTEINSLTYEVTEEDLNEELLKLQTQNARLVSIDDAVAKDGDTVILDFEGFNDGVAFEGGKGENYSLVLGSNTFIPGFEDQLVGVKVGEEKEVNVTFPEEYHAADLSGKPVVFKVKVNEIKVQELPDIDDEFVKDISEFDTLEEFKADQKSKILEAKLISLKEEAEEKVLEVAVGNSSIEVPEPMIAEEIEKSLQNFEYRMKMQGISMEDYFKFTNGSVDSLKADIREDVIRKIKTELVLEKITEVENIEASEEAIQEEMVNYAKSYNIEIDKLKESTTENEIEYFKSLAKKKETVQLLINQAIQK